MKDEIKFKVGQRVESDAFGKGSVKRVDTSLFYPVIVKYDYHVQVKRYTADGSYYRENDHGGAQVLQHSIKLENEMDISDKVEEFANVVRRDKKTYSTPVDCGPELLVNALRALKGVTSVEYSYNFGDLTDEQGLPPRHIEIMISGGDDFEIAKTILAIKPGYVGTFGTTSVVAPLSPGYGQTIINFSRPSKQEINK